MGLSRPNSRRFATVTARTAWEGSKTAVMLQERVKVGTSIEHMCTYLKLSLVYSSPFRALVGPCLRRSSPYFEKTLRQYGSYARSSPYDF